jgi:hypothetical protein
VPTPIARRIVRARDNGASFGAIARELTDAGTPAPAGGATWQESTVRRIYASATSTTPAREAS